jgi:hypothetical protein
VVRQPQVAGDRPRFAPVIARLKADDPWHIHCFTMRQEDSKMRLARIILGFLLFALLWIPGAAKAATFTDEEKAALDRGAVVRHPLGTDSNSEGYLGGTSYAVVNAAPDVVWRAMQDISAFPSILPQTLASEIISDRGNRKVVKMTQGTSLMTLSF